MQGIFEGATDARIASEPSQIPCTRWGTTHLPARRQLVAWRAAVSSMVDVASAGPAEEAFPARMIAWDLGQLTIVRWQLPAASFSRDHRHFNAETPDHWSLTIPLDGAVTIETERDRRIVSPGGVGIYSLRQELRGTNTAANVLGIIVPRDLCPEAPAVIDPSVNSILRSSLAGLLADYFVNLEARLPLISLRHLPAVIEASRAMILSCIAQDVEEAMPTMQALLFERARSYIRRNLNTPTLTIDGLCDELRLSRSSLYRLFEAQGGVVHYIRSCRLIEAHRAFESGQHLRRIHEIAAENGFHDPAAFSRAFKRKFGYSPSEVRSKASLHFAEAS